MVDFKVGHVVETTYGVGVLVEHRDDDGVWVVRLWRQPGKSVATAALAYLQQNTVRVQKNNGIKCCLCWVFLFV